MKGMQLTEGVIVDSRIDLYDESIAVEALIPNTKEKTLEIFTEKIIYKKYITRFINRISDIRMQRRSRQPLPKTRQ